MSASEKVETTEKEENKRQNEVILPLTSRRLVSILVDAFLCFITFMILQTFVIPPLVGAITNIDQIAEAYQNRLVESHLYQRVSGGTMKITGTLTEEAVSPATALARIMYALREGWLLEQNDESREGVPCTRLALDQTGASDTDIVTTVWLRQADGTPFLGEIAVDGTVYEIRIL